MFEVEYEMKDESSIVETIFFSHGVHFKQNNKNMPHNVYILVLPLAIHIHTKKVCHDHDI
jgi:hypothetical protein